MTVTHASTSFRDPGPLKVTTKARVLFLVCVVIGILSFFCGLKKDPTRAWTAFLVAHFYFFCLAMGGVFFASIQWITSAMWSAPVRRVAESFSAYLPISFVTFLLLYFGMHDLYHWTHAETVAADPILSGKASYLNETFFFIRNGIAFVVWWILAKVMVGRSVAQDKDRNPAHSSRNKFLSPVFLIFFGVTFTMASFDLLMSLDPHWFSTMYGVYTFAGLFYSTLAALCIAVIWLRRKGYLLDLVNENHLHDIGKFMFAFTIFYAYIGFSQFMLIWYANLPEETGYFIRRMNPGWMPVFLFLLFGKFAFPFLTLLPRSSKRSERVLVPMAIFMMIAHWVDVVFLVQPEFFKEGPRVSYIEIGTMIGFLGMFLFLVTRFLSKHSVVAIGDPLLRESVTHHHQ